MTADAPRFAVYLLLPGSASPLGAALDAWFRSPPADGDVQDWRAAIARPARYGPHLTIWAPTRIRDDVGADALTRAAAATAAAGAAFAIGPFDILSEANALTLRPRDRDGALRRLSDAVVAALDAHRAPFTAEERARRFAEATDDAARARVERWGYAHVGDGFRPHFTLGTGETAPRLEAAARRHFAATVDEDAPVSGLALLIQPSPGAAFAPIADLPFAAAAERDLVAPAKSA